MGSKYRVQIPGEMVFALVLAKPGVNSNVVASLSPPFSLPKIHRRIYPSKTNMTITNPPFEDVFPIENGDFPMSC